MEQYQPQDAVAAFEQVTRRAPEWVTGRLNLAIALLNAQSDEAYARAEKELQWVIQKAPENPNGHYALGMLLVHLTRFDEAKAQFEAVLKIDPDDPDAHFQLGNLLADDDPPAARRHLEQVLAKVAHHESAVYRLATVLRSMGETALAQERLAAFQRLKESGAGVFAGMKYGEMGRYAEIIRAFERPPLRGASGPAPAYTNIARSIGLTVAGTGYAGWPGTAALTPSAFGPGIAVAEFDGVLHLFFTSCGPDGAGALYRYEAGRFAAVPDSGIDGRNAIGAFFADYDNDGDADLYLTCAGTNRLYRHESGHRFAEVTAATGTGGGAVVSVGAVWADADHDGDLDLYVANYATMTNGAAVRGAPNYLFRNNGDGTFTEMATASGIDGGNAATVGVLSLDFDDDRDLDLYLLNDRSTNRLFLNERIGRYMEGTVRFPSLADDGDATGALVADFDRNGRADVLLLRGPQSPRLLLQVERGRFEADATWTAHATNLGGATSGFVADVDLDGDADVILLSAGVAGHFNHRMLLNRGDGRFDPPLAFGVEESTPSARGAVAVDLDGDGALELIVSRAGVAADVWRTATPGRHWLEVAPTIAEGRKERGLDAMADGLIVETKCGRQMQVGNVISSAGYLGAPLRRAHFGLGDFTKADYVRLSWADGVFQSEMEVAADQRWRISKITRKPSSCPVLFSWNGERFAFVTDFLGGGGLGFFVAPGVYAPPDPTEDVRIAPELIVARHGRFLLRVAEPLEEVTYLDQLRLLAYDHPTNSEVYPNERFASGAPWPDGKPFVVTGKIFPKAARTERGENVRDRVLAIDRRYVEPPVDARFTGYAQDHWIELDFGEALRDLPATNGLVLCAYGWVEYTYSHVNYAAHQAGVEMQAPRLEIPDGRGGWRVAIADAGFPAGLPRMMTLDLSALPVREHGRLRLRTNMDVRWDQIFLGATALNPVLRKTGLSPAVAELRALGYPREFSPDGAEPTIYDYDRVDQGVPFRIMSGHFTRFGDVRALLETVDDQFAIMGRGEEIALEFDAAALPPLPSGWTRTFVLHTDGYCKDMDLYTACPDTVHPLPHHAMKNYPPNAPGSRATELYERTWNTRRLTAQ